MSEWITEMLIAALMCLINAAMLKWTWNAHERFNKIIELRYWECYSTCLIIWVLAN